MFDNLNFKDWPFRTTADEEHAAVWAGRMDTKKQINRLVREILLIPKSNLWILWANFGMGKTHLLYHLQYLSNKNNGSPTIIPVYAVMPKRSTGFLELYREIVQALPFDYLRKQLQKVGGDSRGSVALNPMFKRSPGVVKALLAINPDDIDSSTAAMQWLTATQGLTKSQLRLLDVSYRIKTPEEAINALSALTSLACYDSDPQKRNRLLVMIDEFQRIGELNPRKAAENNSSLHTYFNLHPTYLQLVLTFSCGNQQNVDYLLSPELKSRAAIQAINLDVLTLDEAKIFIKDLFSQFRLHDDDDWAYPLQDATVDLIIKTISNKKSLTPRRLMLYFDYALKQCLLDQDPPREGFSSQDVGVYLNDPRLGEIDKDESDD